MKKILVNLDDDLAKVLAKKPNMSQTVRDALKIYNEDISTDTLDGMRAAFRELKNQMVELEARFVEQYELVERLTRLLEEKLN